MKIETCLSRLLASIALGAVMVSAAAAQTAVFPSATAAAAAAVLPYRPGPHSVILPSVMGMPSGLPNVLVSVPAPVPLSASGTRWQSSLAAFAKADVERHPATDGVLFVGSSTIRMWTNLSQDFRQMPVIINRGFGGSTLADCDSLAQQLVTQYRPQQVLLYAGDNDLAEGRTPVQVFESFVHFVRTVRAELPGVRISYISIKPSPARLELLPKIRETNALISDYTHTVSELRYIDIFTPMLRADGSPRPELFLADKLHMNDAGYQLWQGIIAAHLPEPTATATAHK